MLEYLNLLNRCKIQGKRQKNRTGIDTFFIPGGTLEFDLSKGFAVCTTKKVFFDQVKGELLGFVRGYTNAADFRKLGCKIWDANANDPGTLESPNRWLTNGHRKGEDDLGVIYGAQWRRWENRVGAKTIVTDQLRNALETIVADPTSRRIIVNAWRPDELDRMALPPCHILHQYLVEQETKTLHMTMYQRSCDMFLGVPFNISSYALLLSLVAYATGYQPGKLTMFLADVHIYENHMPQVEEQLSRDPRPLPGLYIKFEEPQNMTPIQWLEGLDPKMISLSGYDPYPAIKAKMAV